MKMYLHGTGAALSLLLACAAHASPELAKSKNCMACHAPAAKLVGPSYQQIAARYAGDAQAEAALAAKIRKGGAGVWGPMAMPANPQVDAEQARVLATWILSQKK